MTLENWIPLNDEEGTKAYYEENAKEYVAKHYGDHPELEQYILANLEYDGNVWSQCSYLQEQYLFECLDSKDNEDHDILEDEESDILEEDESDCLERSDFENFDDYLQYLEDGYNAKQGNA